MHARNRVGMKGANKAATWPPTVSKEDLRGDSIGLARIFWLVYELDKDC